MTEAKIVVLLPCRDEEAAIASVIRGFQSALPAATIYVYDNNSSDQTAARAAEAGAIVRYEPVTGKGNVVRRMFADIDADIYVLADGDGTYDAEAAPQMIERLLRDQLDMVVGARDAIPDSDAYRPGHKLGNRLITGCAGMLFGRRFNDILSGYRVLSRRFVKSFPALATGFEIETELTIHALGLRLPVGEVDTRYVARPANSSSKLSGFRDGLRIGATILLLFKDVRPFVFFGLLFTLFAASSVLLSVPLFMTYMETGLVPRIPTAVLVTGLMLLAFLSLACGMILDSVARARRETKQLAYLTMVPLDPGTRAGEDARGMQSRLTESWPEEQPSSAAKRSSTAKRQSA